MDSHQHEFQQLTRLLHLKRFEVPPPGFERRFRARVMTRIEMEQDWADQSWWERAASALTWQRGLAVANGVALAGVAFLAVATFHIAHTVVNEEEEVQIYAALPLPGIPTARTGENRISGDGLLFADASAAGFSSRSGSPTHSLVIPVTESTQPSSTGSEDASAPSWLFDPPSKDQRKSGSPRFILPRASRPAKTGQ